MKILDDAKKIKQLNRFRVADAIALLPDQLEAGFLGVLPSLAMIKIKNYQELVFCGMGGSNLPAEIIVSALGKKIKIPFRLVRDYDLPKSVGRQSLVVVVSYSGDTEETLACLRAALTARAKVVCITRGGKLAALARKHGVPSVVFNDETLNPSGQPRYGVGLTLGAVLAVLSRLSVLRLSRDEILLITKNLRHQTRRFNLDRRTAANPAKIMAEKIKGKIPIIVSAQFLAGNGKILMNQINESAKNLAFHYELPELNHHLLEGLGFPKGLSSQIKFLFLDSPFYSEQMKKRVLATKLVLKKQKVSYEGFSVRSAGPFDAALEALCFGSWLSFYLAALNNVEPSKVKWVDFFKKELKK